MGWITDLERNGDMDSDASESMEKFDDSFFDAFFEDSKEQQLKNNVTEDDLCGLVFDDTKNNAPDLTENLNKEDLNDNSKELPYAYQYDPTHSLDYGNDYQEETEGAKVLKLTKGDISSNYKDMGNEEGMDALNEFYSDIAADIYENMKSIHEDTNLSPMEKVERLAQESRKWEICKQEWLKDANGKK